MSLQAGAIVFIDRQRQQVFKHLPRRKGPTAGQLAAGEFRRIDLGDPDGPTTVYAFVMVLSHSRKEAVVWSRSMDQLAWHHVHNEAYRRLGGVAAVNRIDNLKTGIVHGCGAWGQIKHPQRALIGHATAAELSPSIRYDKMVEALGGYGELVNQPEEIRPALERAFASGLPACVNVLIDPEKPYSRSTNVAV